MEQKFEMKTKNGHNFYDMASMLQKAIRRSDYQRAGYAANELCYNYRNYLWKRLLTISAEDCFGILTKEIVGLKLADDIVMKNKKEDGDIFVAKAITLLCYARKNRDACYFACNFMNSDDLIPENEIEHVDLNKCRLDGEIPDWVFDCHTLKGKISGKTIDQMIIDEQKALRPHQIGLFDNENWDNFLNRQ